MQSNHILLKVVFVFVSIALVNPVIAQRFTVEFSFLDGTQQQRDALQPLLDESARFWEATIAGYQFGIPLSGVDINVSFGLTGSGAIAGHGLTGGAMNDIGGFSFFTNSMKSRSVGLLVVNLDFVNDFLQTGMNHEIGHVLGFGTLWEANNVYVLGSGQYTGQNGLNAFQAEFDASATYVPIELNPSGGADFHLIESDSIVDSMGRSISLDLMTGFVELDPTQTFFSETSAAIFSDLGYRMNTKVLLGDINCDGLVNLLDVEPFVTLLSTGQFSAKADFTGDGLLNLLDIGPFVNTLSGN